MVSINTSLFAIAVTLVPNLLAQYSGSNFFTCFDIQLPNGTYTSPRCCINYYQSTDGLYTGVDCVGGLTSEDSSIYYCRNGNPLEPPIAGAVNPGCCGWVSSNLSLRVVYPTPSTMCMLNTPYISVLSCWLGAVREYNFVSLHAKASCIVTKNLWVAWVRLPYSPPSKFNVIRDLLQKDRLEWLTKFSRSALGSKAFGDKCVAPLILRFNRWILILVFV